MMTVEKLPNKGVRSADYKESISKVLKKIDSQLREHGLEAVTDEGGSDTYVIKILR